VDFDYDVVIVGSGFGGSVSALRLTEKGYRVGILEAGRRWSDGTLPETSWDLRRFLWMPRLGLFGIQRLSLLGKVMALSGAGVGGGSLVWANVAYEPDAAAFEDPQWSTITDWKAELGPFFDQARRMLGVVINPVDTPADAVIRQVAERLGVAGTYHPTPVAVHLGSPGITVPDPYFGGAGPDRTGCHLCGGCMIGCRFGAKNRLDKNYLYLAEQLGATIHPEHEVVAVVPSNGGYRVVARRPGWGRRTSTFCARQVILAAGARGTATLLHRMRDDGLLPRVSARLGHNTRTNSEALVGATARDDRVDYSFGVAITSSIHPDERTHIEPVRYPKGSNAMGLLSTVLVDGGGRVPRWVRFVATALRKPGVFLRSLSVRHWARRTVILLVMQSHDNALRSRLGRGLFDRRLTTELDRGRPTPTYLPIANHTARLAAEAIGGDPGSTVNEAILDVPMTAHLIGGVCIGENPDHGVVDAYHRVFGHPGLHVVDGSVIGANLGANPSLTIAALAERAMAMWPNGGDADRRPPLGEPYRPVDPVPPRAPAVPPSAPAHLFYAR